MEERSNMNKGISIVLEHLSKHQQETLQRVQEQMFYLKSRVSRYKTVLYVSIGTNIVLLVAIMTLIFK